MGKCTDIKCSECTQCQKLDEGVHQCKLSGVILHKDEVDALTDCDLYAEKKSM